MPQIRFTSRSIAAIKPPQTSQRDYWDKSLPGFGLRVSAGGRKSWVAMYRQGGIKRRLTVGVYPALGLSEAREQASDIFRAVAHGADPARTKKADRKAETFEELAEDYLERHAKPRKRSWQKDAQAIERDLVPRFGRMKAKDVSRRDVRRMLDEIVERGSPIQANRTLEILRKIFNWAISRDLVEANPCLMVERPSPEQKRERVLNDYEIRAVWDACEPETPHMRAMFRQRLVTVQRGGEISHMRWRDLDLASGWWTIPGEYSKNGLAHRVPLSDLATEILETLPVAIDGSEWVFPSPSKKGPITVIWKAAGRIKERSGVDFVAHDLRRTAASRLTGDLGIGRLVVGRILNHVERGVTAVYDRHSYDAEKRRALDAWGARLSEILSAAESATNIVRLVTAGEPA